MMKRKNVGGRFGKKPSVQHASIAQYGKIVRLNRLTTPYGRPWQQVDSKKQ